MKTGAFFVDRKRFDRVMDHQARGLYFSLYGQKLTSPLTIHSSGLFLAAGPDPKGYNLRSRSLTDFISEHIAPLPKNGHNQDVFYYQIAQGGKAAAIIRMVFYGGFIVDAFAPDVAGSPPSAA